MYQMNSEDQTAVISPHRAGSIGLPVNPFSISSSQLLPSFLQTHLISEVGTTISDYMRWRAELTTMGRKASRCSGRGSTLEIKKQ